MHFPAIFLFFALILSSFPAHAQEPWLTAHAAIVIDAATGAEILGKNADTIMYPASTTKIMTALLAVERGDLDKTVKIGQEVNMIAWDSSRAHLRPGDTISLRDLLYGMMLASGNDAAYAVAVHIARIAKPHFSETAAMKDFVAMMNERARELGAVDTNFANPDGYPHPRHYTTARDLALIMAAAMEYPEFREIVQTANYRPQTWRGERARAWNNGNYLIHGDSGFFYSKATGGKTGYTVPAGFTMVATAREEELELVAVALNTDADGRWLDTINLLEYGFENYTSPREEAAEVKFAQVPLLASTTDGEEALKQQAPPVVHPWVEALVNFLARHRGRFSLSESLGLLP